MATNLHRVLENTRWRVEGIDATQDNICGKGFQRLDPAKTDPKEGAALERCFTLAWLGRGEDLYVTDRSGIDSYHKLQLMVLYWPGQGWDDASELVAQDQFDIAQALRRDDYYDGISDSDSATCGIISRTIESMTLDVEDDPWMLTIELKVHMQETA